MVAMFWPEEGRKDARDLRSAMNLSDQHKIETLKKNIEIVCILKKGYRLRTKYGNLYLMKGDHTKRKMAVLIRKEVGNSVQRNYRKRIVRECLRNNYDKINPYNEAIFLYNFSGSISYQLLEAEFFRHLDTI